MIQFQQILSDPLRILGISHLRYLPKKNSVRPLINMSKPFIYKNQQGKKIKYFPSLNKSLELIFYILRDYIRQYPQLIGSAINGSFDLYQKYFHYINHIRAKMDLAGAVEQPEQSEQSKQQDQPEQQQDQQQAKTKTKMIYITTVDIHKCYDHINRDKVYKIINGLFNSRDETFLIEDCYQFKKSQGTIISNKHQLVYKNSNISSFYSLINQQCQQHKYTIFSDAVLRKSMTNKQLLFLFKQYLYQNIVRIGNKYYVQKKGIPQGSILSTLIANILLGTIERKYLSNLTIKANPQEQKKKKKKKTYEIN